MASGTFLPPGLSRSIVKIESGGTDNYVMTAVDGETIQGEANLTFDGTTLTPTASAHNAAGTAISVSAGDTTAGTTNNIAGGALTLAGGQGKGSGAGGDIIFQTANAGGSGSSINSLATALTISDDLSAVFAGNVNVSVPMSDDTVTEVARIEGTTSSAAYNSSLVISSSFAGSATANRYVDLSVFDHNPTARALALQKAGGAVLIGDTANGNNTAGLTINMGAATTHILTFKSSDIAHGLSNQAGENTETDDFAVFSKRSDTLGGLKIDAISEDAANNQVFQLVSSGGTANTDQTVGGSGLIDFIVREHDGSNGRESITAEGNVFSVRARVDNTLKTRFLVEENGDLFADGTLSAYDALDDAHLVRALDIAKNSKDLIRDDWDSFLKYGEDKLVELGILGAKIEDGGLINVTGLQRLHNGAIWQGYVRQQEMQEKIDTLENRLLAIEGAK